MGQTKIVQFIRLKKYFQENIVLQCYLQIYPQIYVPRCAKNHNNELLKKFVSFSET